MYVITFGKMAGTETSINEFPFLVSRHINYLSQALCKNLKCFFVSGFAFKHLLFFLIYCIYQMCNLDMELEIILENYLQPPQAEIYWHFRKHNFSLGQMVLYIARCFPTQTKN